MVYNKIEDNYPTPEQIFDARDEARHRFPNHNVDSIMDALFSEYMSYKPDSDLAKESKKEILRRLKEMVELGYSPACIHLYEHLYFAVRDVHESYQKENNKT